MPNVLSPRDLVSRPDNMDETVLSSLVHICAMGLDHKCQFMCCFKVICVLIILR